MANGADLSEEVRGSQVPREYLLCPLSVPVAHQLRAGCVGAKVKRDALARGTLPQRYLLAEDRRDRHRQTVSSLR